MVLLDKINQHEAARRTEMLRNPKYKLDAGIPPPPPFLGVLKELGPAEVLGGEPTAGYENELTDLEEELRDAVVLSVVMVIGHADMDIAEAVGKKFVELAFKKD